MKESEEDGRGSGGGHQIPGGLHQITVNYNIVNYDIIIYSDFII